MMRLTVARRRELQQSNVLHRGEIHFSRTVRLLVALLFCLVCGFASMNIASAAEATESAEAEDQTPKSSGAESSEPKSGEPNVSRKKDGKSRSNDEIFVPSEEISEDFAVSFPVDI